MIEPHRALRPGDALLVVDVQVDFCPGGALAVDEGDRVVPVLNRWIEAAREQRVPVYASRDWHPQGHPSFRDRGGEWPPHCLQDTQGAGFHPDLALPTDAVLITKGTRFDQDQYSAFDQTGLEARLRADGIRRLWVGGLALDVCVRHTVLDGLRAGFEVNVLVGATRPVRKDEGKRVLDELGGAGAQLEDDA